MSRVKNISGGALDVPLLDRVVEDGETAAQVAEMGCTRLQGYYIARPMPAEQVTEWLVTQHLLPDVRTRRRNRPVALPRTARLTRNDIAIAE